MSAKPPPPHNDEPSWVAQSNLGWILGVNVVFHVLAIVAVALRVYARAFMAKQFGKDDIFISLSVAAAFGGGLVTYIIAAYHGLGRHRDTIDTEDYTIYMKMTFIQAIVSTIGSLMFLKLSVGFALIRVSQQKWYTRAIWGFMAFVIVYTLISWIEWFLVCKPLAGFWDKSLDPVCLPTATHKAFALLNTSCNIFTDIAFATLPVPIIRSLQIKRRTRIYLIGILSLGYFAVLIGIVKTVCQNVFRGQYDQSFYNWIQFWGFLQINIGIIAACAPTLRPLVKGFLHLPTNSGSRYPSNKKYGNGYGASRNSNILGSRKHAQGWVRTGSHNDDYELDDRFRRDGHADQHRTNIRAGDSPSGSEEMIVGGKSENQKGITRTTVVTVT